MITLELSAEQFKQTIEQNPGWAKTISVPTSINGYCDLYFSKITHLSPLLHFAGANNEGDSANFMACTELKTATGKFDGFVHFGRSGIEKTVDLHIKPNKNGWVAAFCHCRSLERAEGTFDGYVDYDHSGVTTSKNLTITNHNTDGRAATFRGCENLKTAEGTFHGTVDYKASHIERIENLRITTRGDKSGADFSRCPLLKSIPEKHNTSKNSFDTELLKKMDKERNAKRVIATSLEIEI